MERSVRSASRDRSSGRGVRGTGRPVTGVTPHSALIRSVVGDHGPWLPGDHRPKDPRGRPCPAPVPPIAADMRRSRACPSCSAGKGRVRRARPRVRSGRAPTPLPPRPAARRPCPRRSDAGHARSDSAHPPGGGREPAGPMGRRRAGGRASGGAEREGAAFSAPRASSPPGTPRWPGRTWPPGRGRCARRRTCRARRWRSRRAAIRPGPAPGRGCLRERGGGRPR